MMLTPSWISWINLNIDRGCDTKSMALNMAASFDFSVDEAVKHIEYFRELRIVKAHPYINLTSNTIQCSDRLVKVSAVMQRPHVVVLDDVLSDEECDVLLAHCSGKFERATVLNNETGDKLLHPGRTSHGVMLKRGETDVIARVENRLAEITHWPVARGEGMQLQKYETSNEYTPHFDWFDLTLPGPAKYIGTAGQRLATVILYLTDVEEGGATKFPKVGFSVMPKKGSAVFFSNINANGTPDQQTLHAGMPVIIGTKVIANKWLRENVF